MTSNMYRDSLPCTICLEFIDPIPTYSVLRSPCCKNAWFHRDCLQVMQLCYFCLYNIKSVACLFEFKSVVINVLECYIRIPVLAYFTIWSSQFPLINLYSLYSNKQYNKNQKRGQRCSSVIDCLLRVHEAPGLNAP